MDSRKQAEGIASLGRYGDTTLMHMRPDEVAQLTAISRANGGDITINPKTGMPEAFLGDFVSNLLPTAAGIAAGSMFGPAGGAIAGGLTSYMQGKRDPLSIGMGALGGYGGANIATNLKGMAGAAPVPPGGAETVNLGTTAADNAYGTVTAAEGTFNPALSTSGGQGIAPVPQGYGGPVAPKFNQYAMEGTGPFDVTQPKFSQAPDYSTIQKPLGSDTYAFKQSQLEQGMDLGQRAARAGNTLERGFKAAIDDPTEFFERMGGKKYDVAGNVTQEGSALAGGIKTALPVVGAAGEAYMRDAYEDTMVRPEEDRKRYYDPSRTLNLGMDTGLRLLAKGGKVEKFVMGGSTGGPLAGNQSEYTPQQLASLAEYGVVPQYQAPLGIGASQSPTRVPVMGVVDVGGKFVADPKGDITDVEYTKRFDYILNPTEKSDQGDAGDMGDIEAATKSGMGVAPGVALNLAQGYAESQQSDLEGQGLGQLRKGGTVKYQQGGQTTAEQNTAKASTPPPATTMQMMIAKKNEEEMAKQGIPAGVNMEAIKKQAGMAEGGISELAQATPEDGKMLNGMGDGVSDDIPAMIEGQQEAALSDGEFIVPARIVSELGNGSSDAGAQKLYSMIDRIQAARKQTIGDDKQYAKNTNAERFLPA